jgi:hypothetical protein
MESLIIQYPTLKDFIRACYEHDELDKLWNLLGALK